MATPSSSDTAISDKYGFPLFLVLIAAGLAGNYFNFPIFFNINFLFGSIFALLALQFFGLGRGILAAALISGYTYILWNNPYAIIIMTAEVAVVGALTGHRKMGLVLADTLYWLVIGMPLVYLFYHVVMHQSFSTTDIIMTKQAVNGIANALVARLIFTGYVHWSRSSLISYREIFYNLLFFFVLFPALILLAVNSRKDFAATDHQIRTTLIKDSGFLTHRVETWILNRKSAIINLAEMAASRTPQQMQPYLELATKSDINFQRIGLLDRGATTTSFYPLSDERGQNNIGRNFAERSFIPTLKRTLKPLLSQVYLGKVGIPKPVVAMVAPVVVGGEYNGYVIGILGLEQIQEDLGQDTNANTWFYTLLDKNKNVIISNRSDQKVMNPFVRGKGTLNRLDKGISKWVPKLLPDTPFTEQWQDSLYVMENTIDNLTEWKLVLEQPLSSFQKRLYDLYTKDLALLLLIMLGALALTEFLSRRMVVTLEKLELITYDLPDRLATSGNKIVWPESGVKETNYLINNFRTMGDALSEKFNEIRQVNESLEQQVEERTRQLSETMRNLNFILDNAPIGIAKIIDRKLAWINRKLEEMFQYSKEEAGLQTTRRLYPSDEAYGKLAREAYPVLAQGLVFETEQELIRKDGAHLQARFIGKALNPQDLSQGVIWLLEDISERKRAEEDIRKSKQQYDNLVSKIPIGVYILHSTPEGAFTLDYVSPRMAEMLDQSVENLLGDNKLVLQALHPDERKAFVILNQEGIEQLRPFNWIGRVLVKGAVKWMHIASSPEPQENGDVLWHGIVVDITERKQAEDALKESEEKFRTLADYTYGWEIWEDSEGSCLYCSPSCARVTGYSPADFMSDPGLLERLIHPDDQQKWQAHYVDVHDNTETQKISKGHANEIEFRILHRDGAVRWISHLCQHIHDAEGRDLGHRISNRDITEHKRLQAEVLKAKNLESLGILAGGIAHDFNNLFQAILGNLELAKMNTEESSKAFPFLEQAVQASGLAGKLTGQLIAFSPGGNLLPVVIQPASHIREEAAATLTGSGLVAEFDLADDLWPVTIDPSQFRNVIKQMVQNAREAMPAGSGGRIRITAANESLAKKHGKHPTLAPGNYVRISIQDQGHGITSEYLPRIFDPYFSTKERGSQKGMGLGLALCEAIIRKYGGAITVESTPGKGTTFHIHIPAEGGGK